MTPTDADLRAFADELRGLGSVLITTHVRPDGDALGTTAAMALALKRIGVEATCLTLSPGPEKLGFLYDGIPTAADAASGLAKVDGLLVCDTGTWSQLPGLQEPVEAFAGRKLVLDHHLTQQDWADRKLVDTTAGAAAEVAMRVIRAMGIEIDEPIATRLYAGMATDTGWFAYSNTSPRLMRLAADCVEAGASPDALYARLYRDERLARVRLFAKALSGLELHAEGRLAVLTLKGSDYHAAEAVVADGEDLINEPMKIRGVKASLLIGENPEADAVAKGTVKVSLRSVVGGVDCARFLERYGGGGHARAAGARLEGSLAEIKQRVIDDLLATGRLA
jgi:phosphoesterase RecJ-like protein